MDCVCMSQTETGPENLIYAGEPGKDKWLYKRL